MIKAFGMVNMSSLCYFNSMIQALSSLPIFVETVLRGESKYRSTENIVALELVTLIKKMTTANVHATLDGSHLFRKFIQRMNTKFPKRVFGTGQEDSGEFLTLFLDVIDDNNLYTLFLHRYKSVIWCRDCNRAVSENNEKGIIVNIQTEYVKNISSFNLNEHVKNYTSPLDSYRCSLCGKNIEKRIYLLARSPEILSIMFNKFDDKFDAHYENKLVFPGNDNKRIEYKLMSTIEHFGGRRGGHYIAHGVRRDSVYSFNDTQVSAGSLSPTRDTYILFYRRI